MPRFVRRDFSLVLQGQADIVEAVQQTVTSKLVHRELRAKSLRVPHFASLQVDRDLVIVDLLGAPRQRRNFLLVQAHGKKAVFCAVIGKNVGERRGDHRAKPEIGERPHGVLARRPTSEVFPGDQNARCPIARLMKHELRISLAVRSESPVIKQELPETCALNALQELLRDDLVGIDVDPVERCRKTAMHCKGFHTFLVVISSGAELPQKAISRSQESGVQSALSLKLPVPNIREMSRDRRRSRHHRTNQMRAPTASLPALKIPVTG